HTRVRSVVVGSRINVHCDKALRIDNRPCSNASLAHGIHIRTIDCGTANTVGIQSVRNGERYARLESRHARKLPASQYVTENATLVSHQRRLKYICDGRAVRPVEQGNCALRAVSSKN